MKAVYQMISVLAPRFSHALVQLAKRKFDSAVSYFSARGSLSTLCKLHSVTKPIDFRLLLKSLKTRTTVMQIVSLMARKYVTL